MTLCFPDGRPLPLSPAAVGWALGVLRARARPRRCQACELPSPGRCPYWVFMSVSWLLVDTPLHACVGSFHGPSSGNARSCLCPFFFWGVDLIFVGVDLSELGILSCYQLCVTDSAATRAVPSLWWPSVVGNVSVAHLATACAWHWGALLEISSYTHHEAPLSCFH